MDDVVLDHLRIEAPEADFTEWRELVERVKNLKDTVKIKMVGKYCEFPDAYLSVNEALNMQVIMQIVKLKLTGLTLKK